ncbi:hypothetical protein AWB71_03288 [Caballeronia peredens]|nr:hypothetical protein AWB71_03288 [Caballeronia peredens]
MGLRNAYRDMARNHPDGWDGMARDLGMSRAALESRVFEKKGQRMHVDTALEMQASSGSTLFAQAVAQISGGTFIALPALDEDDLPNEELLVKFQQILEELGRLVTRHREVLEDGIVDEDEKRDLQAIADNMHRRIQELLAITFRIYCVDEAKGAEAMHKVAKLASRG